MSHKDFLGAAAEAAAAGRKLAVKLALRFTALLPREYSLPATYNMAITVCVRAKDLPHAQQAADMMRSTGRRPDTILYTNLLHWLPHHPPPPPPRFKNPHPISTLVSVRRCFQ
jgi:pentatricopeptide repeat protein